jgi:hypothetical protein
MTSVMEPCVAINGLLLAEGAGKKRAAFPTAASLKRKALAQKSSLANPALRKLELFHGRKKEQKIIFTEGCATLRLISTLTAFTHTVTSFWSHFSSFAASADGTF